MLMILVLEVSPRVMLALIGTEFCFLTLPGVPWFSFLESTWYLGKSEYYYY